MLTKLLIPVIVVLTSASKTGTISWLHKLVAHHRKIFLDDLARLPPMKLPPLTENNAGINTDAYPTNLNYGSEQTAPTHIDMQWQTTGDEKSYNESENKEKNETKQSFKEENGTVHSSQPIENISNGLNGNITVTVEKAPAGFINSAKWDEESVMRLVMLIEVLDARPVKRAIHRALSPPTRRFYVPAGKNTFDLFPSWGRDHPNNQYYDLNQYDDLSASQEQVAKDDTIVHISNPVEARLPSSQITVNLIREIMESRAKALRKMPPTTRATYSWTHKNSRTISHPSSRISSWKSKKPRPTSATKPKTTNSKAGITHPDLKKNVTVTAKTTLTENGEEYQEK